MENLKVTVDRPAFNESIFQSNFALHKPRKRCLLRTVRLKLKHNFKPSKKCLFHTVCNKLPIIDLFRTYESNYFLKDFMSGLTVGIIQIAPTMANATTANLPPINGLYVAFFSVIAYLLFGTSKHLSLGTHGVISLMVANCIKHYDGILYPKTHRHHHHHHRVNDTIQHDYLSNNPTEAKIMIAMSLAFLSGTMQILLGLLNAGFISKYLSDSLVEALTIGSSYLIVVSQIEYLIGVRYTTLKLPFRLADNLIGIYNEINHINWVTLTMSVISIFVLYLVKRLINDRYAKKLPAPIPIELIVVVVATIVVHFFDFGSKYGVSLVGHIPTGIPSPRMPPFRLFTILFSQSFSIAVVAFALNISTAKFYAKKYHYPLNINQELLAYGLGNVLSGLFSGMPATGGLTRTRIVETSGAKTQMFSLVSSVCVLVVILGLGVLLKELAYCVLASIIVAALLKNCFEVKKLFQLFKKSKSEAFIWFCTFCGVMILDIDYGLYIGLGVSIFSIIVRNQIAPSSVLGRIPGTDIYESIDVCSSVKEFDGIKIIRYEDSIYFANAELFYNHIFKSAGINPSHILKQLNALNKKVMIKKSALNSNKTADAAEPQLEHDISFRRMEIFSKIGIKDIILDFSCVNFIDLMGVDRLKELKETLKKLDIQLHLTHIKYSVMHAIDMFKESKLLDLNHIYPTNQDAVLYIQSKCDNVNESTSVKSINESNECS